MLKQRMIDAGNIVFASIDQAAAAASVGLNLRPTTLLVFGNPKAGTALMDAFPLMALELPLKMIVWEQDDKVHVGYTPMSEIVERYDVTGMPQRIEMIDNALDALSNSVR